MRHILAGLVGAVCLTTAAAAQERATLEAEPIPNVLTLPKQYPASWFFAHDVNFFNMLDGKIVLLDAGATTREYKGQLPAGATASFDFSTKRAELYVAETIHERRVRGPRHDYFMAYDTETLELKYEIEIPGVRYQGMPADGSLELIDDDRFALIYNFSPASSVTVIDLDKREVVSEIPIPGCALIYPTGKRGFSSLCGDGGMVTVTLDKSGAMASESRTDPFIDIDNNAMMIAGAQLGDTTYFPTYMGDIIPIDFSGKAPKLKKRWSLLSAEDKAKGQRPGGWMLITAHEGEGQIGILMHEDGREGSHKDPGGEVHFFSVKTKKRKRVMPLKTPAISIAMTTGDTPYLVAFNANLELDIYDAKSGEWLRKIGGLATETAFGLYSAQ